MIVVVRPVSGDDAHDPVMAATDIANNRRAGDRRDRPDERGALHFSSPVLNGIHRAWSGL